MGLYRRTDSGLLFIVEWLFDCEFDGVAVEAVDVEAGGVALEVEAVFFGAAGDDEVVNNLAVDGVDGEGCVEGQVGGNHEVVGGGVGVAGGLGVGGVVVDAKGVGVDFVDHAVAAGEGVAAGGLDAGGWREGEEAVAATAPAPADVEFGFVVGGGTGDDEGVACCVTACAARVAGTVVDGTAVVVEFVVENVEPLLVGVATALDVGCGAVVVEVFVECDGDVWAVGSAAVGGPVHLDGDATGKEEFADGAFALVGAVVGDGVGHVGEVEAVGVDSEFVADGLSVPGEGGSGFYFTAHFGEFPEVDDLSHGGGYAAGGAAGAVLGGAPEVVGGILVPFGLDEDGFAGGVAGEGVVAERLPECLDFGTGLGVVVLVVADEGGVAVKHVLAGGVDVFGVELADGGVGQNGFGAVGGGDDDESVASYVEGVHGRNAEGGVVELHAGFEVVGSDGSFGSCGN